MWTRQANQKDHRYSREHSKAFYPSTVNSGGVFSSSSSSPDALHAALQSAGQAAAAEVVHGHGRARQKEDGEGADADRTRPQA